MTKTTITITASVQLPDGTRIFHSQHTAEGIHEEPTSHFTAMVNPIEKVLSDAHRKFMPTEAEAAEDAAKEGNPS